MIRPCSVVLSAIACLALTLPAGCKSKAPGTSATESVDPYAANDSSEVKLLEVQIRASFEGLPEGAIIVAGVGRDRRYQKIKKSAHQGVPGVPLMTETFSNLIFVSAPLKTASAEYTASYTVELRRVMPGVFDSIAGQGYGTFTDPKLTDTMKAYPHPANDPHKIVSEAFDTLKNDSETDAFQVAKSFQEALHAANVPHRLVQGLLFDGVQARPHAWIEALLPRLGWAPFDPWMARKENGGSYRGGHPPDRLRTLFGSTFSIPKSMKTPAFTLQAPLAKPRALVLGDTGAREVPGALKSFSATVTVK